jgi:hypothetical protein
MTSKDAIASRLSELAGKELASVTTWINQLEPPQHITLLIEICRVMDFWHVVQTFSKNRELKLPIPDFEIMVRGWNPALGLLLSHSGGFQGVPLMESTARSRETAMTLLHQLGRFVVLKESSEMIKHGMAEADCAGDLIRIRMSDRVSTDHFLDRLEPEKLKELEQKIEGFDPVKSLVDEYRVDDLDARMERLLFPWKTNRGIMIGYDAEPDIDCHFLALVTENTLDWRNEAGIHPDSTIGNVSGGNLASIGLLLISSYLKHIRFVDLGKRKVPDANYAMSLTIWKRRSDLQESICGFTGMAARDVSATLDLFTLKPSQHEYFRNEQTPFIPMLIEISENYLLSPVSSIFRNPFHGVRMLQERQSNRTETSIREPRENWMISDLCHLFLGNRYSIVERPTRLKRSGHTVTDIDTAVLDRTSGELALFQLKWQDFSTSEIKKQRSKAKNFVDEVDGWAQTVDAWIGEFGVEALCKSLRLKIGGFGQVSAIRLFAIGRLASRF